MLCCVVVEVVVSVEFDGMVAVVGILKGCGMVLTGECRLVMLGNPIRCCEEAGGSLHSSWANSRVWIASYLEDKQ